MLTQVSFVPYPDYSVAIRDACRDPHKGKAWRSSLLQASWFPVSAGQCENTRAQTDFKLTGIFLILPFHRILKQPLQVKTPSCKKMYYSERYLVICCSCELLVCLLDVHLCAFHVGFYAVFKIKTHTHRTESLNTNWRDNNKSPSLIRQTFKEKM